VRINEGDYEEKNIKVGYLNYEPTISRPGNFGQYSSTMRAFNEKLLLREKLRTFLIPHESQLNIFKKAYFNRESGPLIKLYNENKVTLNTEIMEEWFIGRDVTRINLSMKKLITQDKDFILNRINIYEKQENITKGDIYSDYNDILNRLVLWNPYAMTVLFAPYFSILKNRFKRILKSNVIYAEGYDLNQLNAKIGTFKHEHNDSFFESDLSKQDRQTDQHSLEFETIMYKNVLGGEKNLIDTYMSQHKDTYISTRYFKTSLPPMRHTGQTTVGFGNIINNMRTYSEFLSNVDFKMVMMLGDDLLAVMPKQKESTLRALSKYTQLYHNMRSTYLQSSMSGIFCQLICSYNKDNQYMLVPNLVRLEDRLRSFYKINDDYEDQFNSKIVNFCWMIGSNQKN